jgi:serine phosphatase RsbU (regulator of sigma subunit)
MMKKIYLFRLYTLFARSGIELAGSPHDRKNLLFINKMSMINTVILLAFSITVICFGMADMLLFTVPFMLLFALPPYLNSKGKLFFCRYYFSIIPLFFLVAVGIHNGSVLGDKYLVVTTATIPLILFKHKKTIYSLFALNIAVFFLIEWYQSTYKPVSQLPEFISKQYYIYAQLIMFTVIFFVVQYFRKENEEYESELEEKNKMIQEKNHEIIDSITYAKRLQQAIMPPEKEIYDNVPESFILYKPKDIVAGDFYFADHKGDYFFIAAADCTGHGVPGAMVSMICSNALKRAVEELGLTKPGEILDKVTEFVIDTFKKSDFEIKDGMDISLAVINIKTHQLAWAGANNPLWYIPAEEKAGSPNERTSVAAQILPNLEKFEGLKEIIANKQPVGKSDKCTRFTTHILNLTKGSMLYLFTDGFADQFGGPKGKKFMYRQLAELIYSIRNLSMKEQREKLERAFMSWKGEQEQIDDVCIIGLKI